MKKFSLILTNEKGTLETMSLEFDNNSTTRQIAEALSYNLAKARANMINSNIRLKGFSFSKKFTISVRIGRKIHASKGHEFILNGVKTIQHLETTFNASQSKNKDGEVTKTKADNFETKANQIFANVFETIEIARGEHDNALLIRESNPTMKFIGA